VINAIGVSAGVDLPDGPGHEYDHVDAITSTSPRSESEMQADAPATMCRSARDVSRQRRNERLTV
jgi:hypothetical protein